MREQLNKVACSPVLLHKLRRFSQLRADLKRILRYTPFWKTTMIRIGHTSPTESFHAPEVSTGLTQLPKDIVLYIAEKAGPTGFSKIALLNKAHNAVVKNALVEGGLKSFSPNVLQHKLLTRATAMSDDSVQEIINPLVNRAIALSEAWKAAPTPQERLDCFKQLSHVARSLYQVHARQFDGRRFLNNAMTTGSCMGVVGGFAGTAALFQHILVAGLLPSVALALPLAAPCLTTGGTIGACVGHSVVCASTTMARTSARRIVRDTLAKLDGSADDCDVTVPAEIEMQRI